MRKLNLSGVIIIVLATLLAGNIIFSFVLFFKIKNPDHTEKFKKIDEKILKLEGEDQALHSEDSVLKDQIFFQESINTRVDNNIYKINGWIKKETATVEHLDNQDGFVLFSNWVSEDF